MSLISAVTAPLSTYWQDFTSGQEKTGAQELASSGARSASQRAKEAYGGAGLASPVVRAAVQRAMQELGARGGDRVTFKEIAQYREEAEEEFSLRVRLELNDLGLPPETAYTLRLSSEGSISVACDDPAARDLINRYLAESPETCEQFGYIQALTNVDKAGRNPAAISASLHEAKASLRASVVEAFSAGALDAGLLDYASILADFQPSEVRFYTGLSRTV
jgi:hypothetical protein